MTTLLLFSLELENAAIIDKNAPNVFNIENNLQVLLMRSCAHKCISEPIAEFSYTSL